MGKKAPHLEQKPDEPLPGPDLPSPPEPPEESPETLPEQLPAGIARVLRSAQVAEFWVLRMKELGAARDFLSRALELGRDANQRFQDGVLCSFFVELLDFAKTNCFTPRKAAVAISIVRATFLKMHERSKTTDRVGEPCSVSECFLEYKRLLLAHTFAAAEKQTPGSLGVFALPEVRLLTDFMSSAFFEHYILYQCVLVCPQVSVTRHVEVELEHPLPLPDLNCAKLKACGGGAGAPTAAA